MEYILSVTLLVSAIASLCVAATGLVAAIKGRQ